MKAALALSGVLAIALLGGAGCDSGGVSQDADPKPTVAATTGILADVTSNVVGNRAEVVQIVPDGVSPHDFQLSARGRAELESADLVVANGEGLEAGLQLDSVGVARWNLAEHAGALLGPSGADGSAADPHVWMDPDRVARSLPSLTAALSRVDPDGKDRYRTAARAYARELRRLAASMQRTLAVVAPGQRELVTSHDSLAYFAERFDFEVAATPFPSSGAEAEVSAQSIAEVERAIRTTGVPAIFSQAGDDPAVLEQIARRTGVEVVAGLLVESPGPARTYERMMRRDAELVARALRG